MGLRTLSFFEANFRPIFIAKSWSRFICFSFLLFLFVFLFSSFSIGLYFCLYELFKYFVGEFRCWCDSPFPCSFSLSSRFLYFFSFVIRFASLRCQTHCHTVSFISTPAVISIFFCTAANGRLTFFLLLRFLPCCFFFHLQCTVRCSHLFRLSKSSAVVDSIQVFWCLPCWSALFWSQ